MSTDEPSPSDQWVPALVIESKATPKQRARNRAMYNRLRDGQISPRHGGQENGLSGFVYEVSLSSCSIGGRTAEGKMDALTFRLDKESDCFRRLLSVISDHFDGKCDADDEVERMRATLGAILDAVDYTAGACRINEQVGAVLSETLIEQARRAAGR